MDSLQNVPSHINFSEDEFWPLSGKPCFNVILRKADMRPLFNLCVPEEVSTSFPPFAGHAVFTYRGKEWKTRYIVDRKEGRTLRATIKWREFVTDNNLKEGDACVFEITEHSNALVKIRIQILKGDFPYQLLNSVDGVTSDKPIIL